MPARCKGPFHPPVSGPPAAGARTRCAGCSPCSPQVWVTAFPLPSRPPRGLQPSFPTGSRAITPRGPGLLHPRTPAPWPAAGPCLDRSNEPGARGCRPSDSSPTSPSSRPPRFQTEAPGPVGVVLTPDVLSPLTPGCFSGARPRLPRSCPSPSAEPCRSSLSLGYSIAKMEILCRHLGVRWRDSQKPAVGVIGWGRGRADHLHCAGCGEDAPTLTWAGRSHRVSKNQSPFSSPG